MFRVQILSSNRVTNITRIYICRDKYFAELIDFIYTGKVCNEYYCSHRQDLPIDSLYCIIFSFYMIFKKQELSIDLILEQDSKCK